MHRHQLGLLGLWAVMMMMAALVVPLLVVAKIDVQHSLKELPMLPLSASGAEPGAASGLFVVPVYMTRQAKIEKIPLETYVRGVVAAEVPIEFEPEALKAQAIASRTYIIRKMMDQSSEASNSEAGVTDSEQDQVYVSDPELRDRWGENYERNTMKLDQAVKATADQILTFQGEPIMAVFFSTSNGFTENSEDYWLQSLPYLRSVASPWDAELSPKFTKTTSFSVAALMQQLGIHPVPKGDTLPIQILDVTEGHRIKTIRIANRVFTGREVREKLGLASSQFTWKQEGDRIELTTLGYGHGIGMSQWGADGMAREGKNAEQILTYYYHGVSIESFDGNLKGR